MFPIFDLTGATLAALHQVRNSPAICILQR